MCAFRCSADLFSGRFLLNFVAAFIQVGLSSRRGPATINVQQLILHIRGIVKADKAIAEGVDICQQRGQRRFVVIEGSNDASTAVTSRIDL